MLYTKRGDNGTSGLFGTTQRFEKTNPVFNALGTVDELNTLLGVCRAHTQTSATEIAMAPLVEEIQQHLFIVQAEVAGAPQCIRKKHITFLEHTIHTIEHSLKEPSGFVMPGTTLTSAYFDLARTVARRAERVLLGAEHLRPLEQTTKVYMNRLSSLLYALARYTAQHEAEEEKKPTYS